MSTAPSPEALDPFQALRAQHDSERATEAGIIADAQTRLAPAVEQIRTLYPALTKCIKDKIAEPLARLESDFATVRDDVRLGAADRRIEEFKYVLAGVQSGPGHIDGMVAALVPDEIGAQELAIRQRIGWYLNYSPDGLVDLWVALRKYVYDAVGRAAFEKPPLVLARPVDKAVEQTHAVMHDDKTPGAQAEV